MADQEKITAVRKYLRDEFADCEIRDRHEPGLRAQIFQVELGKGRREARISEEFLSDNAALDIPRLLREFLLAEHLRECDFPLIVTNAGLAGE